MDQTIDTDSPVRTPEQFYDALATNYDAMTGFEKRFVRERPFFRVLVDKYRIKTALDAGSGTGFHSLLLSLLGVYVTAVDISRDMLKKLEVHAHELRVNIKTHQTDLTSLSTLGLGTFDAVFSLGNTLAHFLCEEDLLKVLKQLLSVTKPYGLVVLQVLNYKRILSKKERIQSVTESGGKTYVRYYDYDEGKVFFNIVVTEKDEGVAQSHQTIPLRPILRSELEDLTRRAGWTNIKVYGGISLEDFNADTSTDLVVIARKPEE
jgi:SAM-dependent methyltransferase